MKFRTRPILTAVFAVLTMMLLFGGKAGAKYLSDGATQNASGGWDLPTDGYCAGHPEMTSFPDCKTVTYPSYTTSDTCTNTSTGGANRAWMNACTASDGTPISLKGLDRTAQMCTLNGGTWGAACVAKWFFAGNYPYGAYYGGDNCLRCHNSRVQYSQYSDENNKESYLKTGHKNTLRKVQPQNGPTGPVNASGTPNYTFGAAWAGPDANGNLQIYTTDGTNTVNFSDASVSIVGGPDAGQRNLYWIYGGWISALPSFFYGTDAYDTARTTFGTNNEYPCANCHSTGFQDDSNPGVAGIAPQPWTPAEPLASFPGLSPVTSANARWDQYGIQCSRCHYSTAPAELFSNLPTYPGEQPTSAGMGMLMLRDHAVRINLCFGCHQSTTGTGVSPTPGVAGGDPTKIPTGFNQGTAYGRDFNGAVSGDAIGNSFLNSVHGQFNGRMTTGVGTMIMNPVGTYDLFDPTPDTYYPAGGMATKRDYGSAFTSYDCWMMPGYGYHSYSTNADGTKITNSAQCATAGGSWVAEPEGTCTTCHDVHQSFAIAGDKPIKRQCEDCHTAGGNQSAVGARTVDVSRMLHPVGSGTPFDTTKYESSCVVCHMAAQAVANGDQVSKSMHVWRINTDSAYNTFPSMSQFYGGSCSIHGGTLVRSNSFVTIYSSDTSPANCAAAGGTWTADIQNRLATMSPDAGEGYANAVWVDLDLACGQCHGGSGGSGATHNKAQYVPKMVLAEAAKGMHNASVNGSPVLPAGAVTAMCTPISLLQTGSKVEVAEDTSSTINGSISLPKIILYDWGDGSALELMVTGASTTHIYANPGYYKIRKTLQDGTLNVDGNNIEKGSSFGISCYTEAEVQVSKVASAGFGTFTVTANACIGGAPIANVNVYMVSGHLSFHGVTDASGVADIPAVTNTMPAGSYNMTAFGPAGLVCYTDSGCTTPINNPSTAEAVTGTATIYCK